MEKNMESPERIWANGIGVYGEYEGFGGVEYIRADLAAPSAQPVRFGAGSWVVVTGTYDESPALFIEPSKTPGKVGESAEKEGIPRDRLIPGALVFTFPTPEQARAVADAICCPAPSAPAEVEGLVEQLKAFAHEAETTLNGVSSADGLMAGKAVATLTALQAENERLQGERQALAEAICGGEDFPGLLAATSVDALVDTARREHRCHHETIDARLKAEAERAAWKAIAKELDSLLEGAVSYSPMASRTDVQWVDRKKKARAAYAKLRGDV